MKRAALKRNRRTANLTDTFEQVANEVQMETEVVLHTIDEQNLEEKPLEPQTEVNQNRGKADDGFTLVSKKQRRRPPVKLSTGTSGARDKDLEFVAREPVFHALYVDGMSKKTSAEQVLQWFKNHEVTPFSVWKLKKKGPVSGFCIGLRPKHLKICSNPEFYPSKCCTAVGLGAHLLQRRLSNTLRTKFPHVKVNLNSDKITQRMKGIRESRLSCSGTARAFEALYSYLKIRTFFRVMISLSLQRPF